MFIILNYILIVLQWDTVGQEKYKSLVTNYVREAHGALLVYDITRAESIEHMEDWSEFVKDHALPDTVRIVIGNKTDLEHHRVVPKADGKVKNHKFNKNSVNYEDNLNSST